VDLAGGDGVASVFTYKLIDGKMPRSGGATSLFIIGTALEGGVGRGFQGVGVSLRGPGVPIDRARALRW
jgi:hypothetical protein